MRDEIEAEMEAKHGEQIQIERERLASEKEKFFLLNPTKDALETRLKEAEAAADKLKREVANLEISKERDQASHEYALHAQKCAYEKKLGEVQAKVDRLGWCSTMARAIARGSTSNSSSGWEITTII